VAARSYWYDRRHLAEWSQSLQETDQGSRNLIWLLLPTLCRGH
jgi:hypothetical protein